MNNKVLKIEFVENEDIPGGDFYLVISEFKFNQILEEKNETVFFEVIDDRGSDNNKKFLTVSQTERKDPNTFFQSYWNKNVKKGILENLKQAIEKREDSHLVKRIAAEWKYKNDEPSAIYAALKGRGEINAVDILVLETKFGIHRDEILGSIDILDRGIYRKIETLIKNYEKDELEIKQLIRKVIDVLYKEASKGNNANLSKICLELINTIKTNF